MTAAVSSPQERAYRERWLTLNNGLKLYFREYGWRHAGTSAVLCLPGLARNSGDFNRLAARLAATRRVVCPDYRGRGRSDYDPDWRNYAPPVCADDLRNLLAATNVHHIVAIGTSYGGILAFVLALTIAASVRAIVLNDVGPQVDPSGTKRILAYIRDWPLEPDWPSAIADLRRNMPKLSLKSDDDWMAFARTTFREGADGKLHPNWDRKIVEPFLHGDPYSDLWTLYRGIGKIPTLVVRGGASDILSDATLARMKSEKPDLVDVTVPNVGHAPTLGEPEAALALDRFMARF